MDSIIATAAILGIANGRATSRAESTADGGTFKTTAALAADDAADGRAAEAADDCSTLGVRATGAGGEGNNSEECEDVFHRVQKQIALSEITRGMFTKKRKFCCLTGKTCGGFRAMPSPWFLYLTGIAHAAKTHFALLETYLNMPVRFNLRGCVAALLLTLAAASAPAEQLPLDHPCAGLVKKYLTAVVMQDWKTASEMLVTDSLERRQRETVQVIKSAPTMTQEQDMLDGYSVKSVRELEGMTPQQFYQVDRDAWHKKLKLSPESTKRKQETLKITVLGLVEEKDKGFVHATVRTSQETLTDRIEELFLISFVSDPANPKNWLISPEMKDRPVITPLDNAAPKGEAKGK